MIGADYFARDAASLAHDLIGATLLFHGVGGVIVETEAYDQEDPASHSFRGPTPRNAAMFGPAGHAYVYRSYGVHWCFNIVCGPGPTGQAVLVRALEPTQGLAAMQGRRGLADPRLLCAGPGRLCQALGLSREHDGLPLTRPPFHLLPAHGRPPVLAGPRIGITKGVETPWRFALAGSPYLSRPARGVPLQR
ncbi:DNA-3-methyladenine glycosylase [Alsobacter soli]|uniref:Putative 3-methyladenine DNA glycosylase n=1 Tax=Alsobacter soli TaxID=2109933 RepID=A0A2T1HPC6_9HYPH|nr:DNA-3-methyladenine glycosylase [Alsobacter soli]PSC03518.1 DNA-3-methyladenine glycosylase [Alsobacter soli]